jgi:hypothetical protein
MYFQSIQQKKELEAMEKYVQCLRRDKTQNIDLM